MYNLFVDIANNMCQYVDKGPIIKELDTPPNPRNKPRVFE